jgi:hypothetical protein
MGIFTQHAFRIRHLHLLKHLDANLLGSGAVHFLMKDDDLLHLVAYGKDRIEGTHGFLKDHGDAVAPDLAESSPMSFQNILSLE